jgi:hypothetical protein
MPVRIYRRKRIGKRRGHYHRKEKHNQQCVRNPVLEGPLRPYRAPLLLHVHPALPCVLLEPQVVIEAACERYIN